MKKVFIFLVCLLVLSCSEEEKSENINNKDKCPVCETSFIGLALIRQFEGYSPKLYYDSAGHPTIGYGHLIAEEDIEKFKNKNLSLTEANNLLKSDVKEAEVAVNKLVTADIEQNKFDALSSFTFNLGFGNLQRSTLLKRVNQKKHKEAGNEFLRWVYAGGIKLLGLELRRKAERLLYLS